MDVKKYPRVLVATVTSEHKEYCEDDFIKQLLNIDYPNYDILFVDNTKTDRSGKLLKKLRDAAAQADFQGFVDVERDAWNVDACVRVGTSYALARRYTIINNYDFLLMVESDVFFENKSFLKKWVDSDKPVIAAVYKLYFVVHRLSPKQKETVRKDESGKPYVNSVWYRRQNLENGVLYQRWMQDEELESHRNELWKMDATINGFSLGLSLVNRDVLYFLSFKYDYTSPDAYVKLDLDDFQIDAFMDASIKIDHRTKDWKDGVIQKDTVDMENIRFGTQHTKKFRRIGELWRENYEKQQGETKKK